MIKKRLLSMLPALLLLSLPLSALEPAHEPFSRPLPVPPLESGRRAGGETVYDLEAGTGSRELFRGLTTQTLGYNGDYLGPTLRFRRGEQVRIRVRNGLEEDTTVHWHGMEVPGAADGGPHQGIEAGGLWEPRFTVDQPAATLWYHPHPIGNTARQVYLGLAGLIIIDDEHSDTLDLPKEYGINDVPVIVQDRRFQEDGSILYRLSMPDLMHGLIGDLHLVNGEIKPLLTVKNERIRLRLLNGSNSSLYRFRLSDSLSFRQIAGDGGYLPKPVGTDSLILSPGERAEILLDLRDRKKGDELYLITETFQGPSDRVLKIVVGELLPAAAGKGNGEPEDLAVVPPIRTDRSMPVRRFDLQTMGMGGMGMMRGGGARLAINGRKMAMDRIDFEVRAGSTEIWEIVNARSGMMEIPHSFHVHGVQFQILDINGKRPPEGEAGWKDTVLLWPGDRVRIVVPFREFPGIYMYHCHLLEHEDDGMMGQFEVVR
jgi:FtsP/CotA-like multicopper oxidase with cupredoxin domain